jgi:hypothetical protein
MDRIYSGHGLMRPNGEDEVGAILLVGRLARRLPRRDTARRCTRSFGMTHKQPGGPLSLTQNWQKREIVLAITVGIADQRHG